MGTEHDICILAHPSDGEIALRLAGSLKKYRLPRGVAVPAGVPDYSDVVTDLCDGGGAALLCKRLIVICSPRARSYAPLLESLNAFERVCGREGVIAVIVEGEPLAAFPDFFIEQKTVRHIRPDMSTELRTETVEPVASDLRAESASQLKRMLRYETVRIAASVLGLKPDALERRAARRARRRLIFAASVAGSVCVAAGGIFTWLGLIAENEGDIAAAQTNESIAVAERLVKELPVTFEGNAQALDFIDETVAEAVELLGDSASRAVFEAEED